MSKIDKEELKKRVKQDYQFCYSRGGMLVYEGDEGDLLTIPYQDTLNAQGADPRFDYTMRGITLMRWIRKSLEEEENDIHN